MHLHICVVGTQICIQTRSHALTHSHGYIYSDIHRYAFIWHKKKVDY